MVTTHLRNDYMHYTLINYTGACLRAEGTVCTVGEEDLIIGVWIRFLGGLCLFCCCHCYHIAITNTYCCFISAQLIIKGMSCSSSVFDSVTVTRGNGWSPPWWNGTTFQDLQILSVVIDGIFVNRHDQTFPICWLHLWLFLVLSLQSRYYHNAICQLSDHTSIGSLTSFTTAISQVFK